MSMALVVQTYVQDICVHADAGRRNAQTCCFAFAE